MYDLMTSRRTAAVLTLVWIVLELGYGLWHATRDWQFVGAADRGDEAAVRAYLQQGVRPDAEGYGGMTALRWAAYRGHTQTMRLLLAAGAEPSGGALDDAAMTGHSAALALLVQAGARLDGPQGTSALCAAAESGDPACVALLLDHGVNPNAREPYAAGDEAGMTPLLGAARSGSWPAFRLLVARGADTGARTSDGRTALMLAAGSGQEDGVAICRYLLSAHRAAADVNYVNARDAQGETALIEAADSINDESAAPLATLALLLRGGAEPGARDGEGCTALDYAARSGNERAAALLRQYAGGTAARPHPGRPPGRNARRPVPP